MRVSFVLYSRVTPNEKHPVCTHTHTQSKEKRFLPVWSIRAVFLCASTLHLAAVVITAGVVGAM
jgi:hypothetical protein